MSRPNSRPASGGLGAWLYWPLGGAVMGLAFTRDGLEATALLGFILWMHALATPHPRPLLGAYAGGFTYVFVALTWMHHLHTAILTCTALYFGLYFAIWAAATARVRQRLGLPLWLVAPVGFYAMETLLEHVTVFPVTWLHLGQVAWRVPALVQVAELAGIHFVSFQISFLAAGLYHAGVHRAGLARRAAWLPLGLALASFAVSGGYGVWRLGRIELHDGPRVALVQGNVPQAVRLKRANADAVVELHAKLSLEARDRGVDFVVWPETTSSHFLERSPATLDTLARLVREVQAPLILGAVGLNPPPLPPSNSAFLIDTEGRIAGRADKRILVPFAETLPIVNRIPPLRDAVANWLSRTMHFRPYLTPAREPVVLTAGRWKVGTLICYADTVPYPSEELLAGGAQALVTLSNEAWFGRRELDQHLAMATIRSIETRLPMARATNNGISAIIDPAGRVVKALPAGEAGVLIGALPVTAARPVPWWVRRAIAYVVTALFFIAGLLPRRRLPRGGEVSGNAPSEARAYANRRPRGPAQSLGPSCSRVSPV